MTRKSPGRGPRRMPAPILPPEEEVEMPPALAALKTEKQRSFVRALVHLGAVKGNGRAAVEAAGYEGNDASWRVTAYQLLGRPDIQAAIREQAVLQLGAHSLTAIQILTDIAYDKRARVEDRFKAASLIAGLNGFTPVTKTETTVTHKTDAESLKELVDLAKRNGWGPDMRRQLFGQATADAIEGEFVEVSAAAGGHEPLLVSHETKEPNNGTSEKPAG